MPLRLTIEDGEFRDSDHRQVILRGINVSGAAKFPSHPNQPSHINDGFFNPDAIDFRARPFSPEEAHVHFARLRQYGYNTIRYVFTWEAIEARGPGIYDEEWIQHTIRLLKVAREYGFYVIMDAHQDVWSRFSGGSGAPMWTFLACGLNPRSFNATEAALVHNTIGDDFPKMIWPTNYYRFAAATMFTLFFAGRHFAPKCVIDGVNIQDYLQGHFIAACARLARRIHEDGTLEDDTVVGWESLNEPSRGMIGWQDLGVIPKDQPLRKGTCPTFWQGILLASGKACEVETWDVGSFGPYRVGSALVDPRGKSVWFSSDATDHQFNRHPDWKLGECIWAQHGVWDPSSDALLKKDYFSRNPETGQKLDAEAFTNTYFMDYYRRWRDKIRAIHTESILFCQPPILEVPPTIKGTLDDDPKMAYSPHFYDGITMMLRKWNRVWSLDVIGVLRGRYMHPVFAVRLGEKAIRACLRHQLQTIVEEGRTNMGNHPCVLSEFGIPFDMDSGKSYTAGDYSDQTAAMDANYAAVEGAGLAGSCLWQYMAQNNHQYGDLWNAEDLSIYSVDDELPDPLVEPAPANARLAPDARLQTGETAITPRAGLAIIRPTPVYVSGSLLEYGFDLKGKEFTLRIDATETTRQSPTVVFLPWIHFPAGQTLVVVSTGEWEITCDKEFRAETQVLMWWPAVGRQELTVSSGVV